MYRTKVTENRTAAPTTPVPHAKRYDAALKASSGGKGGVYFAFTTHPALTAASPE